MFTLDDKFFGCFFDVPAASGGGIWSLAGQDGVLGFFPHTHAFLLCSPLPPLQVGPDIRNVGSGVAPMLWLGPCLAGEGRLLRLGNSGRELEGVRGWFASCFVGFVFFGGGPAEAI